MARANLNPVQEASSAQISRFIAQVYLAMGLARVVTAIVAGWVTGNMNQRIRAATNVHGTFRSLTTIFLRYAQRRNGKKRAACDASQASSP